MITAITGESTAGSTTLDTRPCHFTAENPAAASVEPTTPPISACDELDGMPRYQVSRFQVMPPARPANTTDKVTALVLTSPFAIVAATENDRKAPTRFSTPDRATATFGGSAPVAMEVAIALPVSWKPLVKSNASAVITTNARIRSWCTFQLSAATLTRSRISKEQQVNEDGRRVAPAAARPHCTGPAGKSPGAPPAGCSTAGLHRGDEDEHESGGGEHAVRGHHCDREAVLRSTAPRAPGAPTGDPPTEQGEAPEGDEDQ